jgi:hypothetical protein
MEVIASADHASVFGTRHRSAPVWTVQFHPEIDALHEDRLVEETVELVHAEVGSLPIDVQEHSREYVRSLRSTLRDRRRSLSEESTGASAHATPAGESDSLVESQLDAFHPPGQTVSGAETDGGVEAGDVSSAAGGVDPDDSSGTAGGAELEEVPQAAGVTGAEGIPHPEQSGATGVSEPDETESGGLIETADPDRCGYALVFSDGTEIPGPDDPVHHTQRRNFGAAIDHLIRALDLTDHLELPYAPEGSRRYCTINTEARHPNGEEMRDPYQLADGNHLRTLLGTREKQRQLRDLAKRVGASVEFLGEWQSPTANVLDDLASS